MSRRDFIKNNARAGLALGFPSIVPASVMGRSGKAPPSGRVTVGLISCGSRSIISRYYQDYEKSEVVAVCDPIEERRLIKKEEFGGCDDYRDFRELLAREDIDAVHISTPDHWHIPISLAAARAGKDMYTEKPLGICIDQTLAAREIVDTHNRVFQYGTQNRSTAQVRMGIELVLNGHIGEVKAVYLWCPPGESGGSPTPVLPVPKGFDYDLWLGPAPEEPFCMDRCLGRGQRKGVYHIYDYAIGYVAGWGAHPLDQFQWWADRAGWDVPVRVEGFGLIPNEGLFDTVIHWDMTCTYADGRTMRFMDNITARMGKKIPSIDQMEFTHGTLFVGTEGWVAVTRGGWKVFPESLYLKAKDPGPVRLPESLNQVHNFVDSVLSRGRPVSDLASAVKSDLISHFCDICVRTGRPLHWDPAGEAIVGDEEAAGMTTRPMRPPWRI